MRPVGTEREQRFFDIYTDYYRMALFYAKQYVGNAEAAKGIAQEVFLSLWEHIEVVDLTLNIKSFILTITRNKSLNFLRKNKHFAQYSDKIRQRKLQEDATALAHHSAEDCLAFEINDILQRSLEAMPEEMRVAFCLNRYDNQTCQEIAQSQRISSRTVEKRIYKALRILKRNFDDYL